MSESIGSDLERLARDAAQGIAGEGAVEEVVVMPGNDVSDRPAYHFSFLIDEHRSRAGLGLVRIRLAQKLRDELIARGDGHQPVIQLLNREDWDKWIVARPN